MDVRTRQRRVMGDWSNLYKDILTLILDEFSAIEDIVNFGAVCRQWRSVSIWKRQLPMVYPWLMLAEKEDSDRRGFYSLSTQKVYHFNLPEARGRRCWSSYGWLITLGIDLEIHVLNPFSRVQIRLPPHPILPHRDRESLYIVKDFPFFIKRLVLSKTPSSLSVQTTPCKGDVDEKLVVMAISSRFDKLSFLRLGDNVWTDIKGPNGFQDVICFSGQFYAVDSEGILYICDISSPQPTTTEFGGKPEEGLGSNAGKPEEGFGLLGGKPEGFGLLYAKEGFGLFGGKPEEGLEEGFGLLGGKPEGFGLLGGKPEGFGLFGGKPEEGLEEVFGLYAKVGFGLFGSKPKEELGSNELDYFLVESLGELLMVAVIFSDDHPRRVGNDDSDERFYGYIFKRCVTVGFDVYKFNFDNKKWTLVKSLDDRALFVGNNTAFAIFPSNQHPGCEPNCIYFTDSRSENLLEGGGHDMGVFRMETREFESHYVGPDFFSYVCTPLWICPPM